MEDIAVSFKAMTWKSHISLLFTYHLSELNLMVTSSYKLLLLSHFSRVLLCATPWTAAHQAPPSLGFSRQEHWSGLPFPSPVHESDMKSLSHVQLFTTPWTAAYQAPPSMGFSRQEYWSGLPLSSPLAIREAWKFSFYLGQPCVQLRL